MAYNKKKLAVPFMLLLFVFLLMPATAFASTVIRVEGVEYAQAASGRGSQGGTWEWDGSDALELDGYVGGRIYADGALDITLAGDNVVNFSPDVDEGNSALITGTEEGGALTISGAGSLAVNARTSSDQVAFYGIYVYGDFNIEGTVVKVNVQTDEGVNAASVGTFSYGTTHVNDSRLQVSCQGSSGTLGMTSNAGIVTDNSTVDVACAGRDVGDGQTSGISSVGLSIQNGSSVTLSASSFEEAAGIYNFNGGEMSVANSTLSTSASSVRGLGFGLLSEAASNDAASHVAIEQSDVSAAGSTAAMWVYGRVPGSTVDLVDSAIMSPQGAALQNIEVGTKMEPETYGLVIGMGTRTITAFDDADLVKEVKISTPIPGPVPNPNPTPVPNPNPAPQPTPVNSGGGTTESHGLAKTGDANDVRGFLVLVASVAAGSALIAVERRRRCAR